MELSPEGPVTLVPDAALQQHAAYLAAHPGLALGHSAPCGGCRGLFTTRSYAKGELLLREPAVLWQMEDAAARYYFDASATPPAAVATIVHQFAPWHGREAAPSLRALLYEAMKHNSWGCASSRGLFPVLCLANSSCCPNATSEEDAGAVAGGAGGGAPVYALRARRALAAGEEVLVSYVPRAWPKARRAAELRAAWGFACACARCAAPHDDTRAARCRACGAGRVFAGGAACADCGAAAGAEALAALEAEGDAQWEAAGAAVEAMGVPELGACVAGWLAHPVLAADDARVLTALSGALGRAHALAGGEGEGGQAEALLHRVLRELYAVCARSGFAALEDLGVEVEEDEGE